MHLFFFKCFLLAIGRLRLPSFWFTAFDFSLKSLCFQRSEQDTAINQDLRGIIPKKANQLTAKYLFWWLKSIAHKIVDEGTGATVQGVKLPFIKALIVPVPSILKQQSVGSSLDLILQETKRLEAIYQQKLTNLEELKKSILQKAFTGELTSHKVENKLKAQA